MLKNKKTMKTAVATVIFCSIYFFATAEVARAERFCLIADIHNGSGKRKMSDNHIAYPKYGNRYFKAALKRAKANNVDACIILGDNVNNGKAGQAKQLAKTAKKSGVQIIWVKGNHDKAESQRYLEERTNYFVDFNSVRVIVLDSNARDTSANGGVSEESRELYEIFSDTDKKVVLAMHHPPFDKSTHEWNDHYDWIGEKPEYVLGGHFHTGLRSGKYWSIEALTLNRQLRMEYIEL